MAWCAGTLARGGRVDGGPSGAVPRDANGGDEAARSSATGSSARDPWLQHVPTTDSLAGARACGKHQDVRRADQALDDTDRAIIEQLQHDGRLPYTRLATAVGLSEAAVRQRVQRLLDHGAMQVVAVTDPLSLGLRRMAMIGVRAEGDTTAVVDQLEKFRDIEYLVVTAGSFDVMCEVVVEDDAALLELTNRIRSVSGIRSTETFIYLSLVKQTYSWGAH